MLQWRKRKRERKREGGARNWRKKKRREVELWSVPLNPTRVRFMLETELDTSHAIPSQLQGLLPIHEEREAWLWLSRLAFHFNKAFASKAISEEIGEAAIANEQKYITWSSKSGLSFIDRRVGNMNTMTNFLGNFRSPIVWYNQMYRRSTYMQLMGCCKYLYAKRQ